MQGPLRPSIRPVGVMPNKTVKVPAPVPGIAVPKVISQVAKVVTGAATNTPVIKRAAPLRTGNPVRPIALRGLTPRVSAPLVSGAMPRKVWTNPLAAAPAVGRPGAGQPSHTREVGRGRVISRNTR